ncbi:PadR family transcriptional regulator [Bacillus sp. V33-4]|uniref:PadR family transcriptional regulator n=1 Tax=Bacillus sp. V33-4 TaxID=2054169 RepID=UPI000C77BC51|nr:PadR family transcriptional regulator [Bacillus sp. V33-4]PLR80701.1 PadR family transcriptional regulator [Bacillus sp. V33-4]
MTRLMVLGLLRIKPMSGYEIQQILEISHTDLWAGILPGSIYHALKKMEKEGLVEVDTIEQTGHRTKAIYKITVTGEEEFYRLGKESLEVSSVVLPSTMYTAISFADELNKDDIISAISKQKAQLQEMLELQKRGERAKRDHMPIDEITMLTFENIYQQYELQINYLKKLLAIYEQK